MTPSEKNAAYKYCSNCGYKNDSVALKCEQCDTSLGPVTTIATPAAAAIELIQPIIHPPALSVDEVLFLVAGKQNPIILTLPSDDRTLTIGRGVSNMDSPDLNLAEGEETVHSVSRLHARLDFSGEHPTITDLNSTNGTWVNENELSPNSPYTIRTGDLLRLGQQFVFVYFSAALNAVETVVLMSQQHTLNALTPDIFVNTIGGYLQTLAAIQNILSHALEKPQIRVEIKDINVSQSPGVTRLRIAGGNAATRLLANTVLPWRTAHPRDAGQSSSMDNAEISNDLVQLIAEALNTLIPNLTENNKLPLVQQLLPHIHSLTLHSLELFTE